jgi:hypothetical protein
VASGARARSRAAAARPRSASISIALRRARDSYSPRAAAAQMNQAYAQGRPEFAAGEALGSVAVTVEGE